MATRDDIGDDNLAAEAGQVEAPEPTVVAQGELYQERVETVHGRKPRTIEEKAYDSSRKQA